MATTWRKQVGTRNHPTSRARSAAARTSWGPAGRSSPPQSCDAKTDKMRASATTWLGPCADVRYVPTICNRDCERNACNRAWYLKFQASSKHPCLSIINKTETESPYHGVHPRPRASPLSEGGDGSTSSEAMAESRTPRRRNSSTETQPTENKCIT